jgi:hypothetical protein
MYCILLYFKISYGWPDDGRKRPKHVAISTWNVAELEGEKTIYFLNFSLEIRVEPVA